MQGSKWAVAALLVAPGMWGCQRVGDAGSARQVEPSTAPSAGAPPAGWRPFAPPADGKLTPEQVRMYVTVRRRALGLAKEGPAVPASAEQVTKLVAADLTAAEQLGVNTDEYRWVRARVAEASYPAAVEGIDGLVKAIDAASGKARKQLVEKAAADGGRSSPRDPGSDEAVRAYNRSLVERFRAEMEAGP
jgi:hypothetical protein